MRVSPSRNAALLPAPPPELLAQIQRTRVKHHALAVLPDVGAAGALASAIAVAIVVTGGFAVAFFVVFLLLASAALAAWGGLSHKAAEAIAKDTVEQWREEEEIECFLDPEYAARACIREQSPRSGEVLSAAIRPKPRK